MAYVLVNSMDDLNRIIKYNSLLSIYSELLSERQKDILEQYFNFNLSISEIAETNNISRAAVEDAIQKGVKKLDELELKLNINKEKNEINKLLEKANNTNEELELKSILEDIKKVINNGI